MSSIPAALYPKILQLIILPTEKCNFRCTYCYETFEVGKMKRPIIDGIKNLINARVERKTLESLNLSWFGGEPLLAKEIVLELAQHAHDLHARGEIPAFVGDLTTNGYLLDTGTLEALVKLKQSSYQISLDGWGAGHDVTRKYASGKGTFDVIWRNLLAAKQTDLEFAITLRLHMTRENGASQTELVDNICSEFNNDKRFNVFFKPIENLGGPNASKLKTLEHAGARERLSPLTQKLEAAGLSVTAVIDGPESATAATAGTLAVSTGSPDGRTSSVGVGTGLQAAEQAADASANKKKAYSGYVCYAAKPNSLMIRADGTIGKCTVMLEDPRNRVGQINPDGTVVIDSNLVSKMWMRGFVSGEGKELECPARSLPKMPELVPVSLERLRPKVRSTPAVDLEAVK